MKKNSRSSKRIKRSNGRKNTRKSTRKSKLVSRKLVSRKLVSRKLGGVNDPYMTPPGSPMRRRFNDSPQSNLSSPASVYSNATNTPYSPLTPPTPIRVPEIQRPFVPVQRMNLMNRFRQIDQQAADDRDEGLTDDESMSGGKRKPEEMTTTNTNSKSKKKQRRLGDTTWSTDSSSSLSSLSSLSTHLQTPSKKSVESLNNLMGNAALSDTETSSLTEYDNMSATDANTPVNVVGGKSRRRSHSRKRTTRRK